MADHNIAKWLCVLVSGAGVGFVVRNERFPRRRSCAGAAGQAKRQNESEAEIKACWESWEKVKDRYGQIASDRPYHYCGSGRCFYGMGKAMGQGMVELLKK